MKILELQHLKFHLEFYNIYLISSIRVKSELRF